MPLLQRVGGPPQPGFGLRGDVHLRIPAWADARTRVAVNGKKVQGAVVTGRFLALQRSCNNGDRVEFEIGMPLRLEAGLVNHFAPESVLV